MSKSSITASKNESKLSTYKWPERNQIKYPSLDNVDYPFARDDDSLVNCKQSIKLANLSVVTSKKRLHNQYKQDLVVSRAFIPIIVADHKFQ